jgi:serine/threonine-protein kinase
MPMPHGPSRIPQGTRLNEIYEVDRIVAAGGMGEVYRGHAIHTGDLVAIKLLRPEFGENDAALALFRKEASALHSLQHEAIVRYYVSSVDPLLGRPYLAMEFVEGQSLSQLLRTAPLPFESVRILAQRLAAGLHAAHERGIIHRDVAPDNIIVPDGDVARAKIIDFGIARSTRLGEGTIIGDGFAGKYNYVSPEQLGLFGGDVTAKSDIYSLGLVLAEAIMGRALDMSGSQAEVVEKRRKLPDLGRIDPRLRPLLEKMLQPNPANRLDSMMAVANWAQTVPPAQSARAERLPAVAPGRAVTAPEQSRMPPVGRLALAGAAAAVLLVLIGGGAYYFLSPEPAIKEPSAPPLSAGTAPTAAPESAPPSLAPQPPAAPPSAPAPAPGVAPSPSVAPPTSPPPAAATSPPQPEAGGKIATAPPLHGPEPLQPNAATPTLTPAPSMNVGRVDQITNFINSYEGGDCFFISAIAVGERAASVEGLGSSIAPFQRFDTAFKQSNGFEADIGLHQVTAPQCPAISFLNQFRAQRAVAPRLEIAETKLRSGQTLSGTIDGFNNRHVELLLVSDDGSVLNISRLAKPRGDGVAFNLRLQLANTAGAQPQLLLAIASARPLGALAITEPANAGQLFAAAAAEAARTGQRLAVSAKYFKLE